MTRTRRGALTRFSPVMFSADCDHDVTTAAFSVAKAQVERRRWTGIEPAGRGPPVPAALKAVEPTRCPDTSALHDRSTATVTAREEAAAPLGLGRRRRPRRSEDPLDLTVAGRRGASDKPLAGP